MSDRPVVGRFRKIFPRLFRDPRFIGLSEGERLVVVYVLAGPQMNRIGLCHLSVFTAAEDLGTTPETFAKRLANVCATFNWFYDRRARCLYVPSWWTYNRPENENVLKGILNDLGDVPSSALVEAFAKNIETLPETLRPTFIERIRGHLAKRPPIQEHETDPEPETEREQPALTRGHARAVTKKSNDTEAKSSDDAGHGDERLRLVAMETCKNYGNLPFDDLVETVLQTINDRTIRRADVVRAIHQTQMERRVS